MRAGALFSVCLRLSVLSGLIGRATRWIITLAMVAGFAIGLRSIFGVQPSVLHGAV